MMPGYSHSEGEGAMDSTLGPTHANPHQGCGEATPKDQLAAAEGGLSAGQAEGAMDSTLSPTHPNPHQGRGEELTPKGQLGAAEEALSEALSELVQAASSRASDRRTPMAESDTFTGLGIAETSTDATLPAADLRHAAFPNERPSLSRRVARALARFLLAAFIGVGATLAWQSYGEIAKQMIAGWAPQLSWPLSLPSQLGWSPSLPATNSPSNPEFVAEQASIPAFQASVPDTPEAAPVAATVPDTIAAAAPAVASPDLQQLKALTRDFASLQQSVDKLAAGQERMARDIARLQAAEKEIRHKISVLSPQPAAASRKPVPATPEQAASQVSAAPAPAPAPPPTQSRPPVPVR